MSTKHTPGPLRRVPGPRDLEAIKTYLCGHGRGRLTGTTRTLASCGLIRITPTGVYTWCATLTDAGRAAIAAATAVQS